MVTVLEEFRLQSHFCGEFGSPFTEQLLARCADDIEAGGIVAKLTNGWPGHPRADAVSLRLAGALHAATLTGRDRALAAEYPEARADWAMDRVWPVARDFLVREEAFVRDFMKSPPQTNETARATGLACGFLWLAERSPEPFHMLELGASAGLNLNWDRFAYAYPAWGRADVAGPVIPTVVEGKPPGWRRLDIASRVACDQNPLNPDSADDRLRLRAYVWADQAPRMERLNAALDLARETGLKPEKADAAEWVQRKLGGELPAGTSVIYHSVFYQYPPLAVRQSIREEIEAAGARTSRDRRLAWVRFEPESVLGGERGSAHYVLNIVTWEEGRRSEATLAEVDPHGRSLVWRG
ncbi:MAG: DUF2332 domain-containing protein [Alphaproteobacteria bacterium]|nr:MAG: DUF2332 domain-containing protein [Alphaproteobacteria bacterium]